jgi:hypothetical protein
VEAIKLVNYLNNQLEFRGEKEFWTHGLVMAGMYQPNAAGWFAWGTRLYVSFDGGFINLNELGLQTLSTLPTPYYTSVRCVRDK